ncbi:MAG: hypothetical protein D6768_04980 [Chloroflexi bacterium]|nr:MAG: hypothetical protein D6768_04980 [Chloroflexota bacterium]
MLYQITISNSGSVENIAFVNAQHAQEAIEQVEAQYPRRPVQLTNKDGDVETVYWTGFEFEARVVPGAPHVLNLDVSQHIRLSAPANV